MNYPKKHQIVETVYADGRTEYNVYTYRKDGSYNSVFENKMGLRSLKEAQKLIDTQIMDWKRSQVVSSTTIDYP